MLLSDRLKAYNTWKEISYCIQVLFKYLIQPKPSVMPRKLTNKLTKL